MSKPAPAAPPGNRSRFNRFLDAIETAGNKLPDPVFIFIILCVVILIASWLAALTGVSAVNPATAIGRCSRRDDWRWCGGKIRLV